jgi:hypothetical protein
VTVVHWDQDACSRASSVVPIALLEVRCVAPPLVLLTSVPPVEHLLRELSTTPVEATPGGSVRIDCVSTGNHEVLVVRRTDGFLNGASLGRIDEPQSHVETRELSAGPLMVCSSTGIISVPLVNVQALAAATRYRPSGVVFDGVRGTLCVSMATVKHHADGIL